MASVPDPKTLEEAIELFSHEDNCLAYFAAKRWPGGVVCPTCGSSRVGFLTNQRRWQCSTKHPKRQFSVTAGTPLEDNHLGLGRWLCAMWIIANSEHEVSSYELAREIHATQKTASFILRRLRDAMRTRTFARLSGESVRR